jgi:hypothetical protein
MAELAYLGGQAAVTGRCRLASNLPVKACDRRARLWQSGQPLILAERSKSFVQDHNVDEMLLQAIRDRDDVAIESLCHGEECRHFFWVDWREEEESIIEDCASRLQIDMLTTKWLDDKLVIVRDKTETVVPLEQEPGDRHIALCTLNEVLSPDFEIRMLVCSHGGDTLAFCVLPSSDWERLDKEHSEAIAENFLKFSPEVNLFTEFTERDLPPLARARMNRMGSRRHTNPNKQSMPNGVTGGLTSASSRYIEGIVSWLSGLLGIVKK